MPRGPRLDAPGVLHHVMARGIERRPLFRTDADRDDFVGRLAGLAEAGACTVYAWALLPNHVHLLVRTAQRPLARTMRSLLTGYAGAFNRRHRRSGHLFQNRYKSIVCEEEPYLLELVRYLHLNPLRAKVVPDLRALARYPYSGHAALLGTWPRPWQETRDILGRFAAKVSQAQERYQAFVAEGVAQGRRPELQGGGLVRSVGGWAAVRELRQGRERYTADERVLGSSEFVERVRRELAVEQTHRAPLPSLALSPEGVVQRICQGEGVRPEELVGGSRRAPVSRVRAGIAYVWLEWLGHSGPRIAPFLGIGVPAVYRVAQRGRQQAEYWQRIVSA